MIRTSGRQLLHIINDIVDISKLETDQMTINYQACRLYDIYCQSMEMLKKQPLFTDKKEVKLKLDYPAAAKGLTVLTDPHRIQQVIDNLLINALKYTDQGLVELKAEIVETGKQVRFKTIVRDTGSGIPRDKLKIIFERFRQVEEGHYREGAGLGLSISKGIIDLMGGKIDVESTEGTGSKFSFTLNADKAESIPTPAVQEEQDIPDLNNRHVMIAEDDMTSYYLIKEYLLGTGARVSHAPDGNTLMAMIEKDPPDILLLDINIPYKDGYTCLKEIREKGYGFGIIAQTAYAMENEKEKCLNSGCHGYVAKPIDPDILFQEIRKTLKRTI